MKYLTRFEMFYREKTLSEVFQVCHIEFETVVDVEAETECELVIRRDCTELHHRVVEAGPGHRLQEPAFMREERPVVRDIFTAVPECQDHQV